MDVMVIMMMSLRPEVVLPVLELMEMTVLGSDDELTSVVNYSYLEQ